MRLKIPYGYRIVDGRAEPDPVDAPKLQKLFECYDSGLSIGKAKAISGIDRTVANCGDMLKNRLYLGTDYYPRLIADEMMASVLTRRAQKSVHLIGRTGNSVIKPNRILTMFTMERSGYTGHNAPAEQAAMLYDRIHALDNVSRAFSYMDEMEVS